MANSLTPVDVYGIVNAMSTEMFGPNATITAMNTSTFVSVGEAMLRTGYTNTLDALSNVIGRTIYGVRRYNGRFKIILKTPAEWGGIERKISFYAKGMQEAGDWNTNLNATQLDDGQSIDHYVISKKYPLEINFCGIKVMEYEDTTFVSQLKLAFTSEQAFADFVSAKLVDIANDLETKVEAENRLMVLNAIGATYNVGATRQVVNLTTEFNTYYNISPAYTTQELLTTHLAEFVAFMVMRIEGDMELMRERNELFHIYPARNDDSGNALTLVRHTPPEARRLILYMPLIRAEQKTVFPSLFNEGYLSLENYEGVEYWQNPNVPMAVSVTPNQLNTTSGEAETGNAVALSNVVALLFDRDAMGISVKNENALTSPVNARGNYYNTFYHYGMNYKLDQTENMVLYYMAD